MKIKSLLALHAAVLLLFVGAIVSCGPSKSKREEAARQDSIRIADSIAQAEEEARIAAIEAARQDSLDRIEKFKESIPSFREIYLHFSLKDDKTIINLEKLGFSKKVRRYNSGSDIEEEREIEEITYRLELDSEHYCQIKCEQAYYWEDFSFKIIGFPELMDKYKDEAVALRSSPVFYNNGINPWLKIKKNVIEWGDGA